MAMNIYHCGRLIAFLVLALLVSGTPVWAQTAEAAESVCLACHATLPEAYSRPVTLWRGSIHAENGIACNDCHGGNPADAANAMNPAQGFLGVPAEEEIPAFCGRCHVGVLKDYLSSQHGQALGSGGPTCVTCHGSHQIVKATLALINESLCSRCHSYERARRIKMTMTTLDDRITALDSRIIHLKQGGIAVDRLEKGLFAARNRFHSLFHTVDIQVVERESEHIQAELKPLEEVLQGIDAAHRQRRIVGVFVVLGALFVALTAHLLRKSRD
jgi:nitrate/TMAO reductase-like tetraheme cytochrome c subunit